MKYTTIGLSELRAVIGGFVRPVFDGTERVVIEKNGIPVMALVSVVDLNKLSEDDPEEPAGEYAEPKLVGLVR